MYCRQCGAVVVGKFCSCCGKRIRSEAEEFQLAKNRAEREFVKAMTHDIQGNFLECWRIHLARACWLASITSIRPDLSCDLEKLTAVRLRAEYLFNELAATL